MSLTAKFQHYIERQLPRVLTQMDRDKDSPTCGCFDRNYWHYKIRDYPSSILQQGIFTIEALAAGHINLISPQINLDHWRVGAVNALARQVDSRGRVDEYYPFESSYPAAAFSLYAIGKVLFTWYGDNQDKLELVDWAALQRLGNHVASRVETQATNQQAAALAGLALATKLELLSKSAVEDHATRLFNSQHQEGWFDEYGGPDFGYLTVTLDALVDYYDVTDDQRALIAIDRAVSFLCSLVGADNRLPSTLNSRNTDYVVPYGLVKTASRNPQAAWLVEVLFADLDQPHHFCWSTDDRYHSHYIFASIIRSLPYLEQMQPAVAPVRQDSLWMEGCGFWIYWSGDRQWNTYIAARKGGLLRIHRQNQDPLLEYGWRIHKNNQIWTSNWWSEQWEISVEKDTISISGFTQKTQFHISNPYKHLLLRLLAFSLRKKLVPLLKKIMIFRPGNANGPQFQRTITINDSRVKISDRISAFPGAVAIPGPRQNLRHVASADSFSREELLPSLLGKDSYSLDLQVVANHKATIAHN